MPRIPKDRSGNGNPYAARIEKARKRLQTIRPAELKEVRQALSFAMADLIERFESCSNIDDSCRLMNALARGAGAITAIFTAVEFEQRIALIEEKQRAEPHRYNGANA